VGKVEHPFEHLTDAQIEHYGDRTSGEGPNQSSLEGDQAIETHLADCAGCRTRVLDFHRARLGLMSSPVPSAPNLSDPGNPSYQNRGHKNQSSGSSNAANSPIAEVLGRDEHRPTPDCPTEDILRDLAAGLSTSAHADRLTQHAAQCAHCGPILRAYTEDFSDELSPEDAALLQQLNSSSPAWHGKVAQQMAGAVSPEAALRAIPSTAPEHATAELSPQARVAQPPSAVLEPSSERLKPSRFRLPSLKWILVPAALAATAVIAFFIWNAQRDTPEKIDKLLAQAYTEQRTIEMRIPGAEQGPMRVQRATNELDLPAQFYVAEGVIKKNLSNNPEDPQWLHAQARADLLRWNYDSAINKLDAAFGVAPYDTGLLLDKASALYERGTQTGDQRDLELAMDLLGQFLASTPDDPVALFNRAILETKIGALHQAVSDWERYLTLRPSDSWSHEARERLEELRKQIKAHDLSWAEPLNNMALVAGGYGDQARVKNAIEPRIEEYQQLATANWLPLASDRAVDQSTREKASSALSTLATEFENDHSDEWLTAALSEAKRHNIHRGFTHLAAAIDRDGSGEPEQGEDEALKAISVFRRAGASAAAARAALELVFGLQLQSKYKPCLEQSEKGLKSLQGREYNWLKAQFHLENAICANGIGEFNVSNTSARAALELARVHSFTALELRIIGINAFNLYDRGLEQEAVNETHTALIQYWKTISPPVRGYQLYWNLFSAAESRGEWHTAVVYGEEAEHEIAFTTYKKSEAVVHSRVALVALKANDIALAKKEAIQAQTLAARIIKDPSDPYLIDLMVARAEVEVKSGNPLAAMALLKNIGAKVPSLEHYAVLLHYYATLGRSALDAHFFSQSDRALGQALQIAKSEAEGLSSTRDRLAWEKVSGPAYRTAVELKMRQGRISDAFALWEEYRRIAYAVPVQARIPALTDLPKGTTAISWAILPNGLAIWVSGSGEVHGVLSSVDQRALEASVQNFVQSCGTPNTTLHALSSKAQHLYNVLLGPMSSHLPPDGLLLVEPDGFLASLPVQVLRNSFGTTLEEDHPILYTASISRYIVAQLAAPKQQLDNRSKVVVLSASSGGSHGNTAFIYNGASEVSGIISQFPDATLLVQHKGILEETRQKLSHADVFDFVGHGSDIRGRMGLLLWSGNGEQPEILTPTEIEKRRFALKLAVLSACGQPTMADDGLLDAGALTTAFLDAGTTTVIATHWSLDSASAAQYMQTFYGSLLAGYSVPQAAFRASNELRHRYQHPYYWAAFSVFA